MPILLKRQCELGDTSNRVRGIMSCLHIGQSRTVADLIITTPKVITIPTLAEQAQLILFVLLTVGNQRK